MAQKSRPVFLDPRHIAMPVGAIASIGHRISGFVLAVSVPFGRSSVGRHREPSTRGAQALADEPANPSGTAQDLTVGDEGDDALSVVHRRRRKE
jgi:hypothetical protein